ncbi:hypothetical protein IGI04_017454, partial [Brassica rapa subsp. trilocularis]
MGMVRESQFHVLAVDDSQLDRKMIERLLQKSSCQVTTVDSGSKALEFLGLRESNDPNSLETHQVLCLEEGAEEFFLKPVKLADVTKLKPHMMKTKLKKEGEKVAEEENATSKPEESLVVEMILPLNQELELEQQEPMLSSNKRKAMEEVISADRSRPKYNDITTS